MALGKLLKLASNHREKYAKTLGFQFCQYLTTYIIHYKQMNPISNPTAASL